MGCLSRERISAAKAAIDRENRMSERRETHTQAAAQAAQDDASRNSYVWSGPVCDAFVFVDWNVAPVQALSWTPSVAPVSERLPTKTSPPLENELVHVRVAHEALPSPVVHVRAPSPRPLTPEPLSVEEDSAIPFDGVWWTPTSDAPPGLPAPSTCLLENVQLEGMSLTRFWTAMWGNDTSSSFLERIHASRGDRDLEHSHWKVDPEGDFRTRSVEFIASVKGGLGPSETRCRQRQRCSLHEPATLVVVISQETVDIPYGDYFTVHLRWEARQTDDSVTLRADFCLEWHKYTWVQSVIETGASREASVAVREWVETAKTWYSAHDKPSSPHHVQLKKPAQLHVAGGAGGSGGGGGGGGGGSGGGGSGAHSPRSAGHSHPHPHHHHPHGPHGPHHGYNHGGQHAGSSSAGGGGGRANGHGGVGGGWGGAAAADLA